MSRCRNVFRTTVLLLAVLTLGLTTAAFANVIVDFKQSANNETNGTITGLGNVHWINSIVQGSNSTYYEGMSNFQRSIFVQVAATTGNIHTLTLSHQFTKGGIHAYDFLTSYAQGMADDAAALGVPILINECGIEIGPPNTLVDSCNALHSAFFVDIDIPDDPYISKDGSTAAKIAAYEAIHGNRTIRIYGNAPISNASLTVSHDVAAGADNGDSYAQYVLQWTSTSSQIMVEMAGHLAVTGDGTGDSWGPGLGSSQINGGPYHFKLKDLGGALAANGSQTEVSSLGSQDNQIKGADILVPCPTCSVAGNDPVCPGSSNSYTVTIDGTCTSQSTITWALSNNTSGASFVGGNTGTTVTVNAGSSCGSYTLTSSFTCANCINPVTCSQTVSVVDNTAPVLSGCPSPSVSVQCYADVPAAATVTALDNCAGAVNVIFNESQSNPGSSCNNTITRTWTATDLCNNVATCTQVITVNDNTAPVISGVGANQTIECPASPAFSNPTAADACDPNPSLTFADVTTPGNCPQEYSVTRTWTATDACGNSSQASQTIFVEDNTPPSISCAANSTIECPATPSFTAPTVSDLCDPNPTVTFSDATTPGNCPQEYSVTRTWTATDACGNAASCSQTIFVEDNTDPVLTACPDPIVVCEGSPVSFNPPTATDACDSDVPVVCTRSDGQGLGDAYPVGATTITCVATDDCGNSDNCSFTVTVNANPSCSISDGSGFGSPICAGSSTAIVDLFCGPAGMASYSWSVTCGTIDGSTTSQCVSWIPPAVGGTCTFTLTIVDGNGCTNTCTRDVSVPNPTPCVLTPPATLPVCGSTGNSYCGPAGFTDYQWSFSSPDWVITGGQGSQCITYTAGLSGPATLLLDATNSFGCHSSCDVPIDCQPGFEGCTPGFWRNHTGLWNQTSDATVQCVKSAVNAQGAPYLFDTNIDGLTNQLFRKIFGLSASEMLEAGLNSNLTLYQAITLGGGGFQKLARHGVAGLLSSCQVDYTYSAEQVLTMVHDAIINLEAEPTAQQLADANNLDESHCLTGSFASSPATGDVLAVEDDNFTVDPVEKAAGSVLPKEFALRGSYPNPFNASARINFALPQAGTVRLVIYNILGQPVRTLWDGDQPAGERSVLWNGTDNSGRSVSSGVYFYKVSFNGQVKVGRMNLLK